MCMLIASQIRPTVAWSAEATGSVCLGQLAAFAGEQGIPFDPALVTFGARWGGAGHEIKRLPGSTARLPVERCGAVLAVDLGADCRILKSRGEGACRATFPLTFH